MSWREDLLRGDRSAACLREGPAGCERSAVMCLCDLRRSCRLSLQLVSTLVFLCYEEKDVADGDVRWRWKNWLISQWRHIFQAHFLIFSRISRYLESADSFITTTSYPFSHIFKHAQHKQ